MKRNDTLRDRIVVGAFLLLAGLVIAAFVLGRSSDITDIVRELSILITLLLMGEAAAETLGNWRALAEAIGQLADGASQEKQTADGPENNHDHDGREVKDE